MARSLGSHPSWQQRLVAGATAGGAACRCAVPFGADGVFGPIVWDCWGRGGGGVLGMIMMCVCMAVAPKLGDERVAKITNLLTMYLLG